MNKTIIFERRGEIGRKILNIIKYEGYTKSSFSKMTGISRPTLNQMLEGKTPSETTFISQINKILDSIGMTIEELLDYKDKIVFDTTTVAYSNNSPKDYIRKESAMNTLDALDNVLDLYEIYYK